MTQIPLPASVGETRTHPATGAALIANPTLNGWDFVAEDPIAVKDDDLRLILKQPTGVFGGERITDWAGNANDIYDHSYKITTDPDSADHLDYIGLVEGEPRTVYIIGQQSNTGNTAFTTFMIAGRYTFELVSGLIEITPEQMKFQSRDVSTLPEATWNNVISTSSSQPAGLPLDENMRAAMWDVAYDYSTKADVAFSGTLMNESYFGQYLSATSTGDSFSVNADVGGFAEHRVRFPDELYNRINGLSVDQGIFTLPARRMTVRSAVAPVYDTNSDTYFYSLVEISADGTFIPLQASKLTFSSASVDGYGSGIDYTFTPQSDKTYAIAIASNWDNDYNSTNLTTWIQFVEL